MRRALWLLVLLPLLGCGEDEITGVCLYPMNATRASACMNRWNGETECLERGGEPGVYAAVSTCSEEGFDVPCTSDNPQSLWVADQAHCSAWEG